MLDGATNANPAEYRMALRSRLLRSSTSLDVGDAEGAVLWCRCNRRFCLTADPKHFFLHCPSRRPIHPPARPYIWDAIIDQIGYAIRREDPYDNEVEREPLVRAHLPPPLDSSPAVPREENMEVEADNTDAYMSRRGQQRHRVYRSDAVSLLVPDVHPGPAPVKATNIADKAARQCRGDIGVYTDGSRLLVDVAVGKATAPSYRKPPPPPDEPPDPQADASETTSTPPPSR